MSNDRIPTPQIHVIDQQRALASAFTKPATNETSSPWQFALPPFDEEMDWAHALLGNTHPYVINVGAGWPTKVWPTERLIECAQLLTEQKKKRLFCGGAQPKNQ